MNPIVIYHANCLDGFTAAWMAYNYFYHRSVQHMPEFVPLNYGQAFDFTRCAGREVYILDFSFKRPQMLALLSIASCVIVLDHHKTAEAELANLELPNPRCKIVFDMQKSGARLTAEHFFPDITHHPWLVDYTEDRDLWRWTLQDSREVSAALMSFPMIFSIWTELYANGMEVLVPQGRAIMRRDAQIIKWHVERAHERTIAGHSVLVMNATVLFSEIAGELAKGRPFGACYWDRPDGMRQWSLRSTDEGVDVSEIAKSFGGGGHRNAAGFEVLVVRGDALS